MVFVYFFPVYKKIPSLTWCNLLRLNAIVLQAELEISHLNSRLINFSIKIFGQFCLSVASKFKNVETLTISYD